MRPHNLPAPVSVVAALALVLFTSPVLRAQYAISTVAGGGPNNLTALKASIGYPGSIAFDAAGNTYIADSYSSHIFKVDHCRHSHGGGRQWYSRLLRRRRTCYQCCLGMFGPEGVFVDGSGNIFIADTDNSVIREVTASNGNITTVAGNGIDRLLW